MGHWWVWTQLICNTCGNCIGNGRWKSQFISIINCCYYLVVNEWAANAVGGGLGYIKGLIKANIATPLREPDRPLTNDARRHSTCVTQTRCHQKMQVGGLAENYQQNVDIIFNKSKNWSCKMWYRCTLRVLETPLDLIRCQEILWELKITIRCWQYVDNIYNIGNIVKDGFSGNL